MKKWDVVDVRGFESVCIIITKIEKDSISGVFGTWREKEDEFGSGVVVAHKDNYCVFAATWLDKITIQKRFLNPISYACVMDIKIKKQLLMDNNWADIKMKKDNFTKIFIEEDYYSIKNTIDVPPKIVGVSIFEFDEEHPYNSITTNIMFDNITYMEHSEHGETFVIGLIGGKTIDVSCNYNLSLIGGNCFGLSTTQIYREWVKYKQRMV